MAWDIELGSPLEEFIAGLSRLIRGDSSWFNLSLNRSSHGKVENMRGARLMRRKYII